MSSHLVHQLLDRARRKSPLVDSVERRPVLVWRMRNGITITLDETDRRRLDALVADRNTRQKHVWRAWIVLMSADGVGTHAIMAQTGTTKTAV